MECRKRSQNGNVFLSNFERSNSKDLIISWFLKSESANNFIEKFIYLWISFEAWMKIVTFQRNDLLTESDVIKIISNDEELNNRFHEIFMRGKQNELKSYALDFSEMLPIFDSRFVFDAKVEHNYMEQECSNVDMKSFKQNRKQIILEYYTHFHVVKSTMTDQSKLDNLYHNYYSPVCWDFHENSTLGTTFSIDWHHFLWAIYKIRCNLFHGYKGITVENDYILVKYAYIIISNILHTYL